MSPNQGYGGICPHAIGTDESHTPPPDLPIAPSDDAPAIGDQAVGRLAATSPDNSKYSGIEAWRLLGYSTTGTDETWYSAPIAKGLPDLLWSKGSGVAMGERRPILRARYLLP